MPASVPNFGAGVNQNAFTISGASNEEQQGQSISASTNSITNDWSGVDAAINALQGGVNYANTAALGGKGAIAGTATRAGQTNLAGGPQTVSELGKALMTLGTQGAGQSAQVGQASQQESMSFASQAQQLQQQIQDAQLGKYQSDLQLSQAEFQISNNVQQSTNGLRLAQQALQNQLQNALATASNTQTADQLQANQASMNQIFGYVNAGLGALSTAGAGIASYLQPANVTNADPSNTGTNMGDGNQTVEGVVTKQ